MEWPGKRIFGCKQHTDAYSGSKTVASAADRRHNQNNRAERSLGMPDISTKGIAETLSAFIDEHRKEITSEWVHSVVVDPAIQSSESVTMQQLTERLPLLLDDLVTKLERSFNASVES